MQAVWLVHSAPGLSGFDMAGTELQAIVEDIPGALRLILHRGFDDLYEAAAFEDPRQAALRLGISRARQSCREFLAGA